MSDPEQTGTEQYEAEPHRCEECGSVVRVGVVEENDFGAYCDCTLTDGRPFKHMNGYPYPDRWSKSDGREARADGGAVPISEDPHSARELRVAIGAFVDLDLRERVDSIGNSPAAVQFRRETLLRIAFRIPNRRGDARSLRDLSVVELREFIARNLGCEAPDHHFNWTHLRAIHDELADDGLRADGSGVADAQPDDRLKYLINAELRSEIAYAVGRDPTRFERGSVTQLRTATLRRIAEALGLEGDGLEIGSAEGSELYRAIGDSIGVEHSGNHNEWGFRRAHLKAIHRELDAADPAEVPEPEGEVRADGCGEPSGSVTEHATGDLRRQFEMSLNIFVKTETNAHIGGVLATLGSYRDFHQQNVQRSRPVQPGEFVAWMNSGEPDPEQFPEPWGARLVELLDGLIVSAVEEQNLQPATAVDVLDEWVEYEHEETKEVLGLPDDFFDGPEARADEAGDREPIRCTECGEELPFAFEGQRGEIVCVTCKRGGGPGE